MLTALLTALALAAAVVALSGLRRSQRDAQAETGTFEGLLRELEAVEVTPVEQARLTLSRAA